MQSFFKKKAQKIKLSLVLLFFVFSQVFGIFLFAQPVQAAPVTDYAAIQQRFLIWYADKAEKMTRKSFKTIAMTTLLHGGQFFLNKLAHDAAVWLAYGGKGKGAQIFGDSPGEYFEKVGKDAAGDAVGTLGKELGLDLCNMPNLGGQISLQLGLGNLSGIGDPKPTCSWQQLTEGGMFDGDAWKQRYGTEEGLAESFGANLSVDQSEFGIAAGAMGKVNAIKTSAVVGAKADRTEGQGFKPVTGKIDNKIKQPAQHAKKEQEGLTAVHQKYIQATQLAGTYGSDLESMPIIAGSTFLTTFVSTLVNRLIEGLFADESDTQDTVIEGPDGGAGSGIFSYTADSSRSSIEKGKAGLADLFTVEFKPAEEYDIITELSACPSENPGQFNCAMNSSFADALKFSPNEFLTIAKAMENPRLLNGNAQLISIRHADHPRSSQDQRLIRECLTDRFCFSNIQKLRKFGILPLGFEIAVQKSNPDNPVTLKEVVDGFYDCKYDRDGNIVPDRQYPWCNLINPNWLLKAPQAQCAFEAYGPELVSKNVPNRQKQCFGLQTCLKQRENSETCEEFGYCLKQKNVWRMPGNSCDEQYATCKTFTQKETGKVESLLAKTVDYGQCSADNAGCRAFATEKEGGDWYSVLQVDERYKKQGRNQKSFFTKKIIDAANECKPESDGCSAMYVAARESTGAYITDETDSFVQRIENNTKSPIHIKKAPDYLGCYDTEQNTSQTEWPTTIQEARSGVSNDVACNNFAAVCVAEEVGCDAYIPVDGGVRIPAKIGPEYACAPECNGYDTFKQVGYKQAGQGFEEEVFPLHFIPQIAETYMQENGLVCAAEHIGCDEFTNLDAVERGGEGLEYYTKFKYCEEPGDIVTENTFYSWEGSEQSGFVLRTHTLRGINNNDLAYLNAVEGDIGYSDFTQDTPMYADDTPEVLNQFADVCNAETYSNKIRNREELAEDAQIAPPECLALYNTDGEVTYRILEGLITVSEDCHPLRKTITNLYKQENLGERICEERGGTFEDNSCTRCVGGGKIRDGVCVYMAMVGTNESQTCFENTSGCRAYAGNTADNIEELFLDSFEPSGDSEEALTRAKEGWKPENNTIRVAAQATDVGLHSLRVDENSVHKEILPGSMEANEDTLYELHFWAQRGVFRGEQGVLTLNITLEQDVSSLGVFTENISLGSAWQEYRLGPITIEKDTVNPEEVVKLAFNRDGAGVYFIDNVRLIRVQDKKYLIKDAWKVRPELYEVPLACDSTPANGFPGEALGCREYAIENNSEQVRHATGFERLCREKAIGCQPLWDTFNTVDDAHEVGSDAEKMHIYNAFCPRSGDGFEQQDCEISVPKQYSCEVVTGDQTCNIENDNIPSDEQECIAGGVAGDEGATCFKERKYTCTILAGEQGCYLREPIILEDAAVYRELAAFERQNVRISTTVIPADTLASEPIYLSVIPEHVCTESERGCMVVGLEEQILPDETADISYSYEDVMVKNDPDMYDSALCQEEVSGCAAFGHGASVWYFKDPTITGNKRCEYREKEDEDQEFFGWYLADQNVGFCEDNSTQICTEDIDCDGDSACINKGNVPCYANFIQGGSEYGIYANETFGNYDGYVGQCPVDQNLCTELIDPSDSSNLHPEGKPYYVIYNDKVTRDTADCEGKVGLLDGCVLFNKTDDVNKLYNSAALYDVSKRANPPYSAVPIVTAPQGIADTNLLLKVVRDRECSEWLACRSWKYDPITKQNLCSEFKACEGLPEAGETCGKWVDADDPENAQIQQTILTENLYKKRGTFWHAEDYVGYSLFKKYQVNNLRSISFSFGISEPDKDIQKIENTSYMLREATTTITGDEKDCVSTGTGVSAEYEPNWSNCGTEDGGRCYGGLCLYPIDGVFRTVVNTEDGIPISQDIKTLVKEIEKEKSQCKTYPEEDSPFPNDLLNKDETEVTSFIKDDSGYFRYYKKQTIDTYENANVCEQGNCSCEYTELTYRNGETDFWPIDGIEKDKQEYKEPKGICTAVDQEGGQKFVGIPCTIDGNECGPRESGGICSPVDKKYKRFGTQGYCLEYDDSRSVEYGFNTLCLTWLPLRISTSKFDVLASSQDAGYSLTLDAAEGDGGDGGQVYCTNSTDTKGGYYRSEMMSTDVYLPSDNEPGGDNDELRRAWATGGYTKGGNFQNRLQDGYFVNVTARSNCDSPFGINDMHADKRSCFSYCTDGGYKTAMCGNTSVLEDGLPRRYRMGYGMQALGAISTKKGLNINQDKNVPPINRKNILSNGVLTMEGDEGRQCEPGDSTCKKYLWDAEDLDKFVYRWFERNKGVKNITKGFVSLRTERLIDTRTVEYCKTCTTNNNPELRYVRETAPLFDLFKRYKWRTGFEYNYLEAVIQGCPCHENCLGGGLLGNNQGDGDFGNNQVDNGLGGQCDNVCSAGMWAAQDGCRKVEKEGFQPLEVPVFSRDHVISNDRKSLGFQDGDSDRVLPVGLLSSGISSLGILMHPKRFVSNNRFGTDKFYHTLHYKNSQGSIVFPALFSPGGTYASEITPTNVDADYVNRIFNEEDFRTRNKQTLIQHSSNNDPDNTIYGSDNTRALIKESFANSLNSSLKRHDVEKTIRDYDLDTVYFITTGIAQGLDDQVLPELFSLEVSLDINDLREKYEIGQSGEIRGELSEDPTVASSQCLGSNEEFPFGSEDDGIKGLYGDWRMNRRNKNACLNNREPEGNDRQGERALIGNYLIINPEKSNDYSELTDSVCNNQPCTALDERNTVSRRYFVIYYDNKLGNLINYANNRFFDPFDKDNECGIDNKKDDGKNWFAIGMDFNSDGEFLGYITKNCNNNPEEIAVPQLSIIATINDQCVEFASVYKEQGNPISETTNKAWTDRTWEGGEVPDDIGIKLEFNQTHQPYGSLPLENSDVQGSRLNTLRSITFIDNAVSDGVPYACQKRHIFLPSSRGDCRHDFSTEVPNAQPHVALRKIFAKTFNYVHLVGLNDDTNNFTYNTSLKDADFSIGIEEFKRVPKIYSTNPYTCGRGGQEGVCGLGERDNITVNGKNGTAADYDGDGNGDEFIDPVNNDIEYILVVGKESYSADIEFFAWADHNHMPIRRIMVNWDDGNITGRDKIGLYKNAKPLCENNNTKGQSSFDRCSYNTDILCEKESDICGFVHEGFQGQGDTPFGCEIGSKRKEFGNLPRACSEGPIRFGHAYICDEDMLTSDEYSLEVGDLLSKFGEELSGTQARLEEYGYESEDRICVFKPKVQVLDNWGWCNGFCGVEGEDNRYCHGAFEPDEEPQQEGDLVVKSNQCNGDNFLGQISDPWTEYNGYIIIAPEQ